MKETITNYLKQVGVHEDEVNRFGNLFDEAVQEEAKKGVPDALAQHHKDQLEQQTKERTKIQRLAEEANIRK